MERRTFSRGGVESAPPNSRQCDAVAKDQSNFPRSCFTRSPAIGASRSPTTIARGAHRCKTVVTGGALNVVNTDAG